MKKDDTVVLIGGLKKLSADLAELAARLEGSEASEQARDTPTEDAELAPQEEALPKVWTLEEVRDILAEKTRTGFRAEVKAILSAHGAKQLSAITDPKELAAIAAEAEVIGNA